MATRKSGQRARSGASAPRMGPKAAAKKAGELYVKAWVAPLKLAAKGARKVVKAATPRVGRAAKRQTTFTKKVISGQDFLRAKDTPKKGYIARRKLMPMRRRSPKGGGT